MKIGFDEDILSQWIAENPNSKSLNINNAIDVASKSLDPKFIATYSINSMKDLLQVTRDIDYSVKKFIQDTFSKHVTIRNLKNMNRQEIFDKLIKELTGKKL
ncbi:MULTISPECIES: hypothetical protein [Clostridium]|uniref:hypothetical protein n=1 Tax=Clostridium TaxID=1485 RepID=UPI00069E88AD|nr:MULTISPECIES: hypothetical protein [Clostridium]KOF57853.1 hypothetical protein AGR56_16755 [Clostridium sp. DMHC 10]MCD2345082.1 hypothetical protein [Clostridium guangxiense]